MSAPCSSRDYFPVKRPAPATRPSADAPTFAQGVWAVLLDVQLFASPQADATPSPPTTETK